MNRATLARQLLLARSPLGVLSAVEHLGGLQAQTTHSWYIGLWARLAPFHPEEVGRLMTSRAVVRLGLQRSTIHLVTAEDCLWLRPLLEPVLEKPLSNFRRQLGNGLDLDAVAAAAAALVEAEPMTASALGRRLLERWPGRDPAALAQVARARLALVQIPPRGVWGRSGPAAHTTAEAWLGRTLEPAPSVERAVLRYLAAFGPATVTDAQAWCGLTRLGAVFDRLRPSLAVFSAEDGRELFDLPDAPRPAADVPAPVRFLPEYDNLLLSHADRSRFFGPRRDPSLRTAHVGMPGAVLVDGLVEASWTIRREARTTLLSVRTARPLSAAEEAEVTAEGERLLAFWEPKAKRTAVRLTAPPR